MLQDGGAYAHASRRCVGVSSRNELMIVVLPGFKKFKCHA